MTLAMHRASVPVFAPLFEESRLAEQGFVDRSELVKAYRISRGRNAGYCVELLGAAVLELTLRAIEHWRKCPKPPSAGAPQLQPEVSS
jgi:hypothetical protein